jgi:predicted transcriptional regulator
MANQNDATSITVQALEIVKTLAMNPSGNLTADNVGTVMDKVVDAAVKAHRRFIDLMSSSTSAQPIAAAAPVASPVEMVEARIAKIKSDSAAAPVVAPTPAPVVAAAEEEPVVSVRGSAAPEEEATAEAEVPDFGGDEDQMLAYNMVLEHGSAQAAAATFESKRGRKPRYQKLIEDQAKAEIRNAPNAGKVPAMAAAVSHVAEGSPAVSSGTYKFAHIDRKPHMDPQKAIKYEGIVCLIDGESRTMLSRYLKAVHKMTPQEYIAHFNLPDDYPMTAQSYSDQKRKLAEKQGLGKYRTKEATPAPVVKVSKARASKAAPAEATQATPSKRTKRAPRAA